MKIAFATTDMDTVDDHFGWARKFAVYKIDTEEFKLVDTLLFEGDCDNEEDRLTPKIKALSDCAIVYSADIGSVAAARLVKNRIHPMKSKDQESIESVLQRLIAVLRGTPPPWLRRILNKERSVN